MAGYGFVQSVVPIPRRTVSPATSFYSSNNNAGSLLIAIVNMNASGVLQSITDSNNNTWIQIGTFEASFGQQLGMFYVSSCAPGPNTVTIVFSGAGANLTFALLEFSGGSVAPLDAISNASFANVQVVSATIGPSLTGELIVLAAIRIQGGSNWTPGSGYTLSWTGINQFVMAEHSLSSQVGSQTPSMSFNSSGAQCLVISASFIPAGLLTSSNFSREESGSSGMSPSYGNLVQ